MNTNKKPRREESLDPASHTPLPGQRDFSFDEDASGVPVSLDVPNNGLGGSNGQPSGMAMVGTDMPKPEADPFDLNSLRLSQDFASSVGVKKLITTVPIRKPAREWFVKTHPSPDYRLQTAVLELKEDQEIYLVAPAFWAELGSDPIFAPRLLVTAINRQGILFIWPCRLPRADGRIDHWSQSALDAINAAQTQWVRVTANMSLGAYDVCVASGQIAEPNWPDLSFQEIIKIAFRDRMISDWSHPVLKQLRGEA
jgi:hypothetical protein